MYCFQVNFTMILCIITVNVMCWSMTNNDIIILEPVLVVYSTYKLHQVKAKSTDGLPRNHCRKGHVMWENSTVLAQPDHHNPWWSYHTAFTFSINNVTPLTILFDVVTSQVVSYIWMDHVLCWHVFRLVRQNVSVIKTL